MPLVPAYPDWQRVENWDSPILYQDSNLVIGAGVSSPVLDVSRYAYIGGADLTLDNPIVVTIVWFADKAASVEVGRRVFVLGLGAGAYAEYRLPNMGPYCQLTWAQLSNVVTTHKSSIFATNRVHPLEFIPRNPVLIDRQGISVAAGATDTVYPSDYYAGPVDAWFFAGTAGWEVHLDYLTVADAWSTAWESSPSVANTDQQFKVVVPAGTWRIRFQNTAGAAGTYYSTFRHSQTGST